MLFIVLTVKDVQPLLLTFSFRLYVLPSSHLTEGR